MLPTSPLKSRPIILWVEDEPDMREILADELLDAGYSVIQAANGLEALTLLRGHTQPDLILCDIAMPLMGGYELLETVRATMPKLSHVPFVFLSAQDGSEQISQGKYAGADDYLVKPVNFDLMLATIAARLRQVRRMKTTAPSTTVQHLTRMFNLITAGILLLDSNGRVIFFNTAAQRLLADCNELSSLGLDHANHLQGAYLSSTLINTALQASITGREYTEFLSLSRHKELRDLLMTICSLGPLEETHETPAVALFISASERTTPPPLKALESLFKLTPTEAQIAWAFAQGLRPESIAQQFSISATTVAFHKRNIFQKTHTNRQADLIALLLTLPASQDSH